MSQRFAVVHEAEADFQTATELADRVLVESIDWLDEELLVGQREWVFHSVEGWRLTWKAIPRLAREKGIRVHGHFRRRRRRSPVRSGRRDGVATAGDAARARA